MRAFVHALRSRRTRRPLARNVSPPIDHIGGGAKARRRAAGKGKKGATIKNRPEKKEARGSVVRAVGAPFDKHDRAKFVLTDFNLPIDLCTGQKLTVLCLRVGTGACRRWWMLSSDAGRVGTAGAFEAVPPNALYQFAFNIIENLRTSRRRLCV